MPPVDLTDFPQTERRYCLGYCLRLTKNREDAEDLLQSALLKALRSSFDGRCSRTSWICKIARSLFLMQLRRDSGPFHKHIKVELSETLPAREPNAFDYVVRSEQISRATSAIEKLPRSYSICMRLRLNGSDFREISQAVGMPMGSVKSNLHRGKRMAAELVRAC